MQSIALRLRQNLGESERKKCLEPNKTLNRVIKTKDTLVFLIFFLFISRYAVRWLLSKIFKNTHASEISYILESAVKDLQINIQVKYI